MAKENEIVSFMNLSIKAALSDKRFHGSQYAGITILLNKSKTENRPFPCEVDNTGAANWIDADSSKPVQIYHRNNGQTYSLDSQKQFGNNIIRKVMTSMSMFVIGQRKMIKMPVEDLCTLIASGMIDSLTLQQKTNLKLEGCSIILQSMDINAKEIFRREQSDKTLDPQVIMFELKYQIECSYGNGCINTICCS